MESEYIKQYKISQHKIDRIKDISLENFQEYHSRCVNLIRKFGNKHIAQESLDAFRELDEEDIRRERAYWWILFYKGTQWIVGVSVGSDYYEELNFTVVSKNHRNQGWGSKLMDLKLKCLPRYSCWVSSGNEGSLKMVTKVGLFPTGNFKWMKNERFVIEFGVEKMEKKWKYQGQEAEEAIGNKIPLLGVITSGQGQKSHYYDEFFAKLLFDDC